MKHGPSPLSTDIQKKIAETLNARLAEGLDLYSQIKVAHWNIRGPHYATFHPLFDTFATSLVAYNDTIAERAVILGDIACGTVQHVAKTSGLPEYPLNVTRDIELARLLLERILHYIKGLHQSYDIANKYGDNVTADLLTGMQETLEEHAWFLHASLDIT